MDTNNIPRSFWHACSFAIICTTVGLVFIAWKSSNVSIEIANMKIQLSSALSSVKQVRAELEGEAKTISYQTRELQIQKTLLDQGITNGSAASIEEFPAMSEHIAIDDWTLRDPLKPLPDLSPRAPTSVKEVDRRSLKPLQVDSERFRDIDNQIQSVEQILLK